MPTVADPGLCACGCGTRTRKLASGAYAEYLTAHHPRTLARNEEINKRTQLHTTAGLPAPSAARDPLKQHLAQRERWAREPPVRTRAAQVLGPNPQDEIARQQNVRLTELYGDMNIRNRHLEARLGDLEHEIDVVLRLLKAATADDGRAVRTAIGRLEAALARRS